jgi:pyrroline-5-carboxylate reductase
MEIHYKVGFIGAGNMSQAIIKGLIESKIIQAKNILVSNRSQGKLQKLAETWGITACANNEQVIEGTEAVILAMKPQDMLGAVDSLTAVFNPKQIVISLAAGITTQTLKKRAPNCRIARVMPNTPALIQRGVVGYLVPEADDGLSALIEDLFKPLGFVIEAEDESQLEALTVGCAAGTGFVFEFMCYFQEWIEERGFEPLTARKMVIETFAGASLLASYQHEQSLEELQQKVTSKKGVTAAGLQSMRELEIERLLRYSLEKAALRNQELAKQS